MYLEETDREKIVDYLVINKKMLRSLPQIKLYKKQFKEALKDNDSSLHDDISTQFLNCCKGIIAENVSRNTGLAADGIIYILDYIGIQEFEKYLKGKGNMKRKPTRTKKNGNGSVRK